ncbi:MAG: hypothetical protein HFE39_08605 [Clostridiales bacterium]|nr:hypothetical protein [Clostridiales bacterium]
MVEPVEAADDIEDLENPTEYNSGEPLDEEVDNLGGLIEDTDRMDDDSSI